MKQLIDLLPGLIFLAVYFYTKNFMVATMALLISSAAQLAFSWFVKKQLEKMQLVIFLILLPTATLTLLFHNVLFLKWKPSIINWLFAMIIWGSYYLKKRNLTQVVFQRIAASTSALQLNPPDFVWRRANHVIAWFFTLEGILNLIVAYGFSTSDWVIYKVGGVLILNTLGLIALFGYLFKHHQE